MLPAGANGAAPLVERTNTARATPPPPPTHTPHHHTPPHEHAHKKQVVRAAIQLDEGLRLSRSRLAEQRVLGEGRPGNPHILAQLMTPTGSDQLEFSCGARVTPLLTKRAHASRQVLPCRRPCSGACCVRACLQASGGRWHVAALAAHALGTGRCIQRLPAPCGLTLAGGRAGRHANASFAVQDSRIRAAAHYVGGAALSDQLWE